MVSPAYATTTPDPASPEDPTINRALNLIESGTRSLEEGDLEAARVSYKDSLGVKETSGGWFNLGVSELLPLSSLSIGCRSRCRYANITSVRLVLAYLAGITADASTENQQSAIDAWESSNKLSPSADAYTSRLLSPTNPSLCYRLHSRSSLRIHPVETTTTCSRHQASNVSFLLSRPCRADRR